MKIRFLALTELSNYTCVIVLSLMLSYSVIDEWQQEMERQRQTIQAGIEYSKALVHSHQKKIAHEKVNS